MKLAKDLHRLRERGVEGVLLLEVEPQEYGALAWGQEGEVALKGGEAQALGEAFLWTLPSLLKGWGLAGKRAALLDLVRGEVRLKAEPLPPLEEEEEGLPPGTLLGETPLPPRAQAFLPLFTLRRGRGWREDGKGWALEGPYGELEEPQLAPLLDRILEGLDRGYGSWKALRLRKRGSLTLVRGPGGRPKPLERTLSLEEALRLMSEVGR